MRLPQETINKIKSDYEKDVYSKDTLKILGIGKATYYRTIKKFCNLVNTDSETPLLSEGVREN
jgi:transposase-like protein